MVQPILASVLYHATKSQSSNRSNVRTSSGYETIDEALHGGIQRGQVTCISGERGTGKTLITLHIVVTHLLSNPSSQAAIIDTTGTLDVLRLHSIIVARIKAKRGAERASALGNVNPKVFYAHDDPTEIDNAASQALDRVKIMRVFDFVGVGEAINELRDEIKNSEENEQLAAAWAAEPTQKTHIADSQADDEDDDDDDVMLFDGTNDEGPSKMKLDPVSLVAVDNITTVVNPHLKTDYVQGQALLTTFMRSLSLFTVTSNLTTLVLNNAASSHNSHPSFPNLQQLNSDLNVPPSTYISDPLATTPTLSLLHQPSIFSSTTARPSLGKTFTGLVDCHILLSMVPKKKRDAEVFVGGKAGEGKKVNVLEVLSERGGDGLGRWAAFEIVAAGTEMKMPI